MQTLQAVWIPGWRSTRLMVVVPIQYKNPPREVQASRSGSTNHVWPLSGLKKAHINGGDPENRVGVWGVELTRFVCHEGLSRDLRVPFSTRPLRWPSGKTLGHRTPLAGGGSSKPRGVDHSHNRQRSPHDHSSLIYWWPVGRS